MSFILEDSTIPSAQKVFSVISHVTFLFNEQIKESVIQLPLYFPLQIQSLTLPEFGRHTETRASN